MVEKKLGRKVTVLRDKYKPCLVKTDRLFSAVDTVDKQSKKKRDLLRIE